LRRQRFLKIITVADLNLHEYSHSILCQPWRADRKELAISEEDHATTIG